MQAILKTMKLAYRHRNGVDPYNSADAYARMYRCVYRINFYR